MIKSLKEPLNPLGLVIKNPRSLLQMTSTSEVINLEQEEDDAFCSTPQQKQEEQRGQRQPVIVSTQSLMASALLAVFDTISQTAAKEVPVAVASSPATSPKVNESKCVITSVNLQSSQVIKLNFVTS